MTSKFKVINSKLRIKCSLIDVLCIYAICIPFMMLYFILTPMLNNSLVLCYAFIFALFFSVFLCKDFLLGKSVGKRLFNLKVVNTDNSEPSLSKLIIRNVFIFAWPIEFVMYLVYPERRFGDIVCSTKIIYDEGNKKIVVKGKNIIVFAVLFLAFFAYFYFIATILSSSDNLVNFFD